MSKASEPVSIWDLQDRRKYERTAKPWVVRWRVGKRTPSRAFATKAEAQAYESRLRVAKSDGERFDPITCLPVSWVDRSTPQVHVWVRRWLAQQWPEWQPRTRESALNSFAKWLPLLVSKNARAVPEGMQKHLMSSLDPKAKVDPADKCETWLTKYALRLDELTPEAIADAMPAAATGRSGQRYAETTARRQRTVMKSAITGAVDLGVLERNPWPKAQSGRSRRKTVRKAQVSSVNKKRLPSPDRMRSILDAMASHQPGSEMYRVMAYTMWLGGLRPSEVVDLDVASCKLPDSGWGELRVDQANVGEEEPGDPKTGPRTVPIPPELVSILSEWIDGQHITAFLFRTRSNKRPTNLGRTLHRACDEVEFARMRPYDLRHTAATTYLNAGVAPGEVAKRMGHSVETLLGTYAGVLEGDDARANRLFEDVVGSSKT